MFSAPAGGQPGRPVGSVATTAVAEELNEVITVETIVNEEVVAVLESSSDGSSSGGVSSIVVDVAPPPPAVEPAAVDVTELTDSVGAAFSSAQEVAASSVSAAADALSEGVQESLESVQESLESVSGVVGAAASQLGASAASVGAELLELLPEEVRPQVAAVAAAAAAHPTEAVVLSAAVAGPLAFQAWQARYGGYAGELRPQQVLDLLNTQDTLLVDIRPDAQRQKDGLPRLRLAARFKAVAFPLRNRIDPRLGKRISNAAQLSLQLNALYVSSLQQVRSPLTRIVVMDNEGGDYARSLARSLAAAGMPLSFIVSGGFQRWRSSGLEVTEGGAEYEASPVSYVKDELEELTARLSKSALSDARVGGLVAFGGVMAVVAVVNYHTTLQFLGVLGLLLTAARRVLGYSSPDDAQRDLSLLAGPVTGLVSAGTKLLPAATTASSSKKRQQPSTTSAAALKAKAEQAEGGEEQEQQQSSSSNGSATAADAPLKQPSEAASTTTSS